MGGARKHGRQAFLSIKSYKYLVKSEESKILHFFRFIQLGKGGWLVYLSGVQLQTSKSVSMKSVAKSSLYFSAYPLKVLEEAAAANPDHFQSEYLQSLLDGKTRSQSNLRISPMKANVYAVKEQAPMRQAPPATEAGSEHRDWFRHYE